MKILIPYNRNFAYDRPVNIIRKLLTALVGTIAVVIVPAMSSAQTSANEIDPQKAREEAELRVESEMVQMNSIVEAMAMNLGQLHYLRTLCFTLTDQKWRTYASQMMDVEAPGDGPRRENLVKAFNKGFFLEQERHTTCSQAVSLDVAALAENSRNLAGMLGDPYRVKTDFQTED